MLNEGNVETDIETVEVKEQIEEENETGSVQEKVEIKEGNDGKIEKEIGCYVEKDIAVENENQNSTGELRLIIAA